MTSPSQTAALIARYPLTPGVSVGPLRFGDLASDHPELVRRDWQGDVADSPFAGLQAFDSSDMDSADLDSSDLDSADLDGDYLEFTVAGLDEFMIVYVDGQGRIDSVGFYEFCLVESQDLIGMGVGELLVRLGLPDVIEAEQIGRGVELLYSYCALGLTAWTIDGEVCVVVAGAPET